MKKGLLYISDISEDSAIYHSQVKQILPYYNEWFNVVEICFSKEDIFTEKKKTIRNIKGSYNPVINYFLFLKYKSRIESLIAENDIKIVIGRGTQGGIFATYVQKQIDDKLLFIVDIRADALDETKRDKNYFATVSHALSLKYIFKNVNFVFCVSTFLKKQISKKYSVSEENIFIFPTIVSESLFYYNALTRKEYRQKYGFEKDDIVLIYSGNLAKYQNLELILQSFEKSDNERLKLVVLTKYLSEFKVLCDKMRVKKNVLTLSVKYENVTCFLQMADYGLLIRDSIATNLASSPTKFGEYINSGLNVILNKIDTDYYNNAVLNKMPITVIEDKKELLTLFNRLEKKYKEKIICKVQLAKNIAKKQYQIFIKEDRM